ncbi:MAG: tetratricopeptide repeat protein [Thermodesulfovibrionales bacterium]
MPELYKKGDFIGQKYEVYDVLGEGGFGIVYLVYSHQTKSVYALKTFRDDYLEDITTRERFKREAQVWVDLERYHNLVRVSFIDEISGRLYIAMEYIASDEPGMNTLEGYLRHRPPDLAQSLRWAIQFCHGMEYAYSKGIKAHRDIKPANIMIDQHKTVKITDFGLAGILAESSISEIESSSKESAPDSFMRTLAGTSIGTPEYMSPEQFENLSACDERSDIYSFGVVLYQMASKGKLPFIADNPTYRWAVLKHCHQETPVPILNSILFSILLRCLEKEPRKRYQSFKELRLSLESLLMQEADEVVILPEIKELDVWELEEKGVSLANIGKNLEAIACFDSVLEVNPTSAPAWCNKGLSLIELGKHEEAIACFDRSLEIDSKEAYPWVGKGNALGKLGKHQERIACYDRVLEIDPNDVFAWFNKGNALKSVGKHEEALVCFDRALEIDPRKTNAWVNKGNTLKGIGKHEEALVCYDRALEIDPRKANAWFNKGNALKSVGKHEEALICFDRVLAINPREANTWKKKGDILSDLCKYEEALVCFDRAIDIDPNNTDIWGLKAQALLLLDKPEEALDCYEKALATMISPTDAIAWCDTGNKLNGHGKYDDACFCFDKALEINPDFAEAWNCKGLALGKLGRYEDALACYDKASRIK